jgi:uncharacterized protein YjdB
MKSKVFKNITVLLITVLCILVFPVEILSVEASNSHVLETPTNLRWDKWGSVKWDRVEGEDSYELCLYKDNQLFGCRRYGGLSHFDNLDSLGNFYIFLSQWMYEDGDYTFTVQAIGKNNGVQSDVSVMSEPFKYIHPGVSLATPTNLSLDGNILNWEADNLGYPAGTGFYEVVVGYYYGDCYYGIGGLANSLNENSINIEKLLRKNMDGMYRATIRAVSNNIHYIGHSKESEELLFSVKNGSVIDGSVISDPNITLDKTNLVLEKGKTTVLNAATEPADADIKWSSSDKNVVTVDNNGKLCAVGYGKATIKASITVGDKSKTTSCTVTVPGIELNKNSTRLLENRSEKLSATFVPSDSTVKWKISDESIATIKPNENGNECKVTAKKDGKATITAEITANGKKFVDTCSLRIIEPTHEGIAKAYVEHVQSFNGNNRNDVKENLSEQAKKVFTATHWCSNFIGAMALDYGLQKVIPNCFGVRTFYISLLENKNYPAEGFHFVDIKNEYGEWFEKNSNRVNKNEFVPKVGDLIFFKWEINDWSYTFSHVGIVTDVKGAMQIEVIHGNNSDGEVAVRKNLNFRGNNNVVAFVRPNYGAIAIIDKLIKEFKDSLKFIFKCPVDVCITLDGEELNSATNTTSASFGTMTIDEDCISVELDYGNPYSVVVTGKGEGTMEFTTEFDTDYGQNTRTFIDVPITDKTTIYVSTNSANAGIELLVNDGDKAAETIWYAEPGETVHEADEELTESYLNQGWYEENDDSNQTEWKIWEPKCNIEPDKTWTIKFNKILDTDTVRESNIYVTDGKGQIIPTYYQVPKNTDKTVCVEPADNYISGHTYTLWIRDLKAMDGSILNKNVKMEFTILSSIPHCLP